MLNDSKHVAKIASNRVKQIYACLIAYVILQLVTIPQEFGHKVLDKLRYLQAFVCENISYVHWLQKLVFC